MVVYEHHSYGCCASLHGPMIGPRPSGDRSLSAIDRARPEPDEDEKDVAVQWGAGCLVGAVALVGTVLLVALLAFYLEPPTWVQIVVGVTLPIGGVAMAWLVATALARSRAAKGRPSSPSPHPSEGNDRT